LTALLFSSNFENLETEIALAFEAVILLETLAYKL